MVLNGVMLELRFKYDGVCMELQGSIFGASTYVLRPRLLSWVSWNLRRSELDRSWIGVGSELGSVKID